MEQRTVGSPTPVELKRCERSRGVSGGKRCQERRERRGGSRVGKGGLRHVSIIHYEHLTTVSQLTAAGAENVNWEQKQRNVQQHQELAPRYAQRLWHISWGSARRTVPVFQRNTEMEYFKDSLD
ncbi:Protein of unknown function [Pyronema omphalodes CBS 100304]|uniref:Uncharacterized protein n=1 Tax=Pyronema omphalodes (strain CBS 100304) TaxID=1076935 RepID=U4LP13_PYROM|nr:Protein of unknown function [Pyronema omphalodes CBS 100304]